MRRRPSRRLRFGGYSAFAFALALVIAVAANLMVSALPASKTQFDLKADSIYKLSDQTRQILAGVDRDVTLTLLANEGSQDRTILRLLERYAETCGRITVRTFDAAKDPTFLEQYDFSGTQLYLNSVIVSSGDRYRLVNYPDIYVTDYSMNYSTYSYETTTQFDGENALTNAIHYVTSANIPKVYFTAGHGEAAAPKRASTMLERDNIETETASLLTMQAVPEDAGALAVIGPKSDISSGEADMLCAYLDGGGRIVLLTDNMDPEKFPNLMRVAKAMGMEAKKGLVAETDDARHLPGYPWYLLPVVEGHAVTDAIVENGYYVLVPLAQPIGAVKDEAGETDANVLELLYTSDAAYCKADGTDAQGASQQEGDETGRFCVGAVSERGDARMAWFASAEMLEDSADMTVGGTNSDLFVNAVEWMCDQRETISIRARSLDEARLTLSAAQSRLWSAVLVGIVPLAFVLAGIRVAVRRNRK